MKNRRNRPSAFLKIDLPDFIEAGGHISESPDESETSSERLMKSEEAGAVR